MSRLRALAAAFALAFPALMLGSASQAADVSWDSVSTGELITAGADLNVRAGPGVGYIVVDTVDIGGAYIISGECINYWCEIEHAGEAGWTYFSNIHEEGWEPTEPFGGPRLNWGRGGPGEVCFYDGPNYTGSSICLESGDTFLDLGASGRDNWISSIRVTGDVSTTVCRDADLINYCILAVQDKPQLDRLLNNQITSLTVH